MGKIYFIKTEKGKIAFPATRAEAVLINDTTLEKEIAKIKENNTPVAITPQEKTNMENDGTWDSFLSNNKTVYVYEE